MRVIKHAGYLIHNKYLTQEDWERALKRWTYRFYNERACAKCEFFEDRHVDDVCGQCKAFLGARCMAKPVTIKDNKYLSLPYGDKVGVRKFLKRWPKFDVVDKHPDTDFAEPITLLGKPYAYQEDAVAALIKHRCGVLDSPPRSGKTVMATVAICKIGKKAIILAHQRDWLNNFAETFLGSPTQEAFTDATPERVKFCKTLKDFQTADVAFATIQQFMSPKGQLLLSKIRSLFPILCVDEAHGVPALQSSKIIAQFNARYRFGLTGTPERKNAEEFVAVDNLFGPTIYKTQVQKLVPQFEAIYTGCKTEVKGRSQAAWPRFVTSLENNEKRTELLVRVITEGIEKSHMVLVPCARVKTVFRLVKLINHYFGEEVAKPFTGSLRPDQRNKLIEDARNYKVKCIIGVGKIVSTGLNIPRASMLVDHVPTNNRPGAIQRISRILTPYSGKPTPVYVRLLDDGKEARNCFRSEWWSAVYKEFKPTMSKATYAKLKGYLANAKFRPEIEEDDIKFGV